MKPVKKNVSTDNIIDLAEVVLKNNVFTFGKKTLKESEYKPYLWCRYIDDIFFLMGTW